MAHLVRPIVVMVACVATLAACGSGGTKPAAAPASSTTVTTAGVSGPGTTKAGAPATTGAGPAATTSTTSTRASSVTVTDAITAVTIHRGDTLHVVLGSTYWTFQPPSNGAVLTPDGAPVVAPKPCIPGGGCGTVTEVYATKGAGKSAVLATRTSCGEAMGCTGSSGRYTLNVTVT